MADESEIYKQRELDRVKIGALPKTAMQYRGWDSANNSSLGAIDRSKDDTITRWYLLAAEAIGDARVILNKLHENSQGMHQLDRFVGNLMMTTTYTTDPIFGFRILSYAEWCRRQRTTPRGRVIIAMVSIRFRLDRNRGNQKMKKEKE